MIRKNIIRSALVGGIHTSPLSIITSIIFSLLSFFYVYTVGSYLKIKIVYLQDRVTYDAPFSNIYIINQYVDHIVLASGTVLWLILSIKEKKVRWLISSIYGGLAIISATGNVGIVFDILTLLSVPIMLSCWIYDFYNRSYNKNGRNFLHLHVNSLVLNYILVTGIIISIETIVVTVAIHFLSVPPKSIPIRNYSYFIFMLLGSLSPIFMVLLIFSFPVKILIDKFNIGKLKTKKSNNINSNSKNNNINKTCTNNYNSTFVLDRSFRSNNGTSYVGRRKKIIYLLAFMLLSIIIVLVPHQPTINKNNQQIGVDTVAYVDWLNPLIKSNNFQEFIRQASVILQHQAGDRPLSVIFVFAIVKLVNNPDISYVVEHVPVILGPALVLVTYFLTRELTSNDTTSLLAAFLTTISFQVLIGVYSGYYANWLALIIGYLSIVFLIRFLKGSSHHNNKINFIIFFILLVLLQFTHVYTWTILTPVIGIFLAVMLKLKYYDKRKLLLPLLTIVCLIVIDVAIVAIWASASVIERELTVANRAGAGLQQFAKSWDNLVHTTQVYFLGLYSNFIILSLGLYWLYRSNLKEQSTIFLVIFLSMGIVPIFFGDILIQSRLFYDIAFQIPAAIGLNHIRQYRYSGNLMLVSICMWLFAVSIRAVSNFATTH